MKHLILLNCITLVCLSSFTHAQDTSTADKAKKQIPTNKAGIENAADAAKRAVAPAVAKDKKLAEMIERSKKVTKQNAKYLQDVAAGKVVPFGQLKELYSNEFPKTLANLTTQYDAIFAEKNPVKQKEMVQVLQKALFPIGAYLKSSPYENANMTLSKVQHAELVRLQKLDPRSQVGKKGLPELRAQSDKLTYTLLHLPVYMKVKAQPHSTVYFRSGGGGQFSNGLPLQEVKANQEGVASTTWVSKGDSVGVSNITVTSPQSSSPDFFRINVVGLSLNPLPKMPQVKQSAEDIKKKLETLKEQHSSTPKNPLNK